MAGAGYKLFNTGDVLTAAQVNTYLQEQAVMRFANATARTTALSGVLAEGMMSYLDDTNSVEVYNGSAWVSVGSTGDITGVTAGTGISGGGSSGDVTITNSMATAIDAKGDLIAGTGADSFSRLAVGSNNTVLTADSSTATGLKWAAPTTPSFVGCQAINDNFSLSYTQYATVTIPFASADKFDTDGFHDPSTNNSRITIPSGKGGKYLFTMTGFFGAQANYATINFRKNNADYEPYFGFQMYTSFGGTVNGRFSGAVVAEMAAGDYAEYTYFSDKATGTITGCYATFTAVFLGA